MMRGKNIMETASCTIYTGMRFGLRALKPKEILIRKNPIYHFHNGIKYDYNPIIFLVTGLDSPQHSLCFKLCRFFIYLILHRNV